MTDFIRVQFATTSADLTFSRLIGFREGPFDQLLESIIQGDCFVIGLAKGIDPVGLPLCTPSSLSHFEGNINSFIYGNIFSHFVRILEMIYRPISFHLIKFFIRTCISISFRIFPTHHYDDDSSQCLTQNDLNPTGRNHYESQKGIIETNNTND